MPSPEWYLIPPVLHPHILFTSPPLPSQHDTYTRPPLADYNYCSSTREALLVPAPLNLYEYAMPSKHVHWADVRTPSPTHSADSRQSSLGPRTPSPVYTALPSQVAVYHPVQGYATYLSPQTPLMKTRPLPPMTPAAMQTPLPAMSSSPNTLVLHNLLSAADFAHASTRPFYWRVTDSPVKTLVNPSPGDAPTKYVVHPSRLSEPATTPPVSQLRVEHPYLPYNIIIKPSPLYGLAFVTVGDVLTELYQMLRLSVSQLELNNILQHHPGRVERFTNAHRSRIAASRDRKYEESRGVRRVDLLMGETEFAGLETKPGSSPSVTLKLR